MSVLKNWQVDRVSRLFSLKRLLNYRYNYGAAIPLNAANSLRSDATGRLPR